MTPPWRTIAATAMLALAPLGASGQPDSPHGLPQSPDGSVPDVPAGPGAIRGRVVHERDPQAVGDVPIILYSLSPGGVPGLRGTTSAADGSFAFEAINNDPETVYLLGARYADVPFGTRLAFAAGELVRDVELPIDEPTSITTGARVDEVLIQVQQSCDGLFIRESHLLVNPGDQVIYVPEAERAERDPILRIALPAGATELQATEIDSLVSDGETLAFWGPLRPGSRDFEFTYGLPPRGASFDFRRTLPAGARRVRLLSRPGGPTLSPSHSDNANLQPGESVEIEGLQFDSLEARDVAPGVELAIDVELPARREASDRISAIDTRIWHELDGASLTIDQQLRLSVSGDTPLVSESGAPLLCIDLPATAEELRFSSDTLTLGLSRDPSGALAIQGPLPAGETQLSLRYRLPVTTDAPRIAHSLPVDVPLLTVLVADTGLVVETNRLHRRQPLRTSDRVYIHLEGFEIARGESIDLQLKPLAARRPLPKLASAGLAVAAALVAIGFLTGPLRAAGTEEDDFPQSVRPAADERESVLEAIRALDEDFEVGKVTEVDYRKLRQRLRAEAVHWLRQEREANERPEEPALPRVQEICPECGTDVGQDALFCSHCGVRLSGHSAPQESSG